MASATNTTLSCLTNPLVTSKQLIRLRARDTEVAVATRFATALLTQAAGVLFRLPQEVIATAIVLLQRYQLGCSPKSGSYEEEPASRYLSAAAIYLAAKNSFTPLGTRSVVNVYAFLLNVQTSPFDFIRSKGSADIHADPQSCFVSEGDYERERVKILHHENLLLAGIGFDIHVALPYTLSLTYLSALGAGDHPKLATRVFEHLNGALLSPQLPYQTHQPNVLATAAIYLAANEKGVKLAESVNWWEVFDVDREGLGFCVMAMNSLQAYAESEKEKWTESTISLA